MRKIYLKNVNAVNEKKMKKLNDNYIKRVKKEKRILCNDGFYKFIDNKLFKFNIKFKIISENDISFDIEENYTKCVIYQIPYDNIEVIIETYIYKINDETNLIFEYYKNKLNDFYIITKTKLHNDNYILKKEISCIKDLII
tara:strand:- start:4522 stop:4944 length:423 start_codon:yes stop_codon:yes gene_type:complete